MAERERDNVPTQDELDFNTKHKADWEEIYQFYETMKDAQEAYGEANPQYRLAPEYFQIYLERRPSKLATRALSNAFTMWSNLEGTSDKVQETLKQISYHEDVWDKVGDALLRAFDQDDRLDEGLALLDELVQKVIPLKSRSALLFTLAREWMRKDEMEKAHQGFEQILEWNASKWHLEQAKGYIYEINSLNIGQPAPHFSLEDIDGNLIDLADYHGKVVLLHFWSTGCGWCRFVYPHLRKIARELSEDKVVLIGISTDTDFEALRAIIREEGFAWPQICEGNGWKDTVVRLFNVTGIPAAYILDRQGNIAFKIAGGKSGEELEEAVRSLIV